LRFLEQQTWVHPEVVAVTEEGEEDQGAEEEAASEAGVAEEEEAEEEATETTVLPTSSWVSRCGLVFFLWTRTVLLLRRFC